MENSQPFSREAINGWYISFSVGNNTHLLLVIVAMESDRHRLVTNVLVDYRSLETETVHTASAHVH